MQVQELMTRNVQACTPETNLAYIGMQMDQGNFGCVPVVDKADHVIGIVTDRDICIRTMSSPEPTSRIHAGEIMSRDVHDCRPDDSVEEALAEMREYRVRRLPVVDDDGKLQGLLSLDDVALAAKEGRSAHPSSVDLVVTMKALCRSRDTVIRSPLR